MKTKRNLIQICLLCAMLQALTSGAQPVTKIASGNENNHSFFIKSDGSLWGMGDSIFGDLGIRLPPNRKQPNLVLASNVMAVAAGYQYSHFVLSDGSRWAVGLNTSGQLGDGTYTPVISPERIEASNVVVVAAGYNHTLYLKRDGSFWVMGDNSYGKLGDTLIAGAAGAFLNQ